MGGVAFAAADDSVYKFYLPREDKKIGSVFGFRRGDESALLAEARLGDYRGLLEKLLLIHALGRELEVTDRPHIRKIVATSAADGYRLRDLILLCAESEILRRK